MNKWKKVKLGDVTVISSGNSAPQGDEFFTNGIFPFCRTSDVGAVHLSTDLTEIKDKLNDTGIKGLTLFKKGTILIPKSGASTFLNHRAILGLDSYVSSHLATIQTNENFLFNLWAYYFFVTLDAKMLSPDTNYPTLKLSTISNIEIPLPAMEEQKKIAARLDAVSDLLTKQKQLLSEQDTLIQSIFYDMFGDLERNSKFPIKELADVCHLITDGVHKKPIYTENGIPFISVKDITTGNLCFDDCKFISIKDHNDYCSRCFPEYNDILYTKVGATYGKAAIVNTHKEFSLYVSVALLKPKKEIINSIFLKTMMNTTFIKKQADKSIKGIGVPDLHLVEIKKFKVTVPPLELQEKFALIVEQIETEKSKIKSAITETQTLFNALMAEYFEE